MQMVLLIASVLSVLPWSAVYGRPDDQYTLGDHGDERNPVDGTYSFHYEVPGHSGRLEELDASGSQEGSYYFVSPEGEKFEFKYEADEDGFVVESDALPVAPEDTDEVKQAKEEFFKVYCKALGDEDCDIRNYDKHQSYEAAEDYKVEEEGEGGGGEAFRKSISGGSFSKRIQNLRNMNSQTFLEKEMN